MNRWCLTLFSILLVAAAGVPSEAQRQRRPRPRPHIVIILADDLGWNDVSFHGSNQIPTPNIDALAYNGVVLNNYYTQPLCTPSRAALLSGLYPIHTGMQHGVVLEPEPWGLPLEVPILPEYLRALGYRTHAVGKWHLGFFRGNYTPEARGFLTHYGLWNGYHDYYTHQAQASFVDMEGYDLRRGMDVDWSSRGKYSTDLFTEEAIRLIEDHPVENESPLFLYLAHLAPHAGNYEAPLQAPAETIAKFDHIKDPERRVYAAMVSKLDESVGRVMAALREKNMLANSVIVFASDNGAITRGIHPNKGSNWPLKGVKGGPWEGAVRGVACVWSPLLRQRGRSSQQMMHATDWLPTLLAAAGAAPAPNISLDGVNLWQALSGNSTSPRKEVLINIDDRDGYAALRVGPYKYVNGTAILGYQDFWVGDSGLDEPSPGFFSPERALSSVTARAILDAGLPLTDVKSARIVRAESILRCPPPDPTYPACLPRQQPCLFNLEQDPCERRNLFGTGKVPREVVLRIEKRLAELRQGALPAGNQPADFMADPSFWNKTWAPWGDLVDQATLLGLPLVVEHRQRLSRWGK